LIKNSLRDGFKSKNARCTGRRSVQRADLKSATGRRSVALRVQFLGGGVKLNNPKIGAGLAAYKGRCCNAVMHLRIAKKRNRPAAIYALGRLDPPPSATNNNGT